MGVNPIRLESQDQVGCINQKVKIILFCPFIDSAFEAVEIVIGHM